MSGGKRREREKFRIAERCEKRTQALKWQEAQKKPAPRKGHWLSGSNATRTRRGARDGCAYQVSFEILMLGNLFE